MAWGVSDMSNSRTINLSGKDYFSVDEAAEYCCVSVSQFNSSRANHPKSWGQIRKLNIMGKVTYSRRNIQNIIEQINNQAIKLPNRLSACR